MLDELDVPVVLDALDELDERGVLDGRGRRGVIAG